MDSINQLIIAVAIVIIYCSIATINCMINGVNSKSNHYFSIGLMVLVIFLTTYGTIAIIINQLNNT